MKDHEDIKEATRNNTYDNYKYSFSPKLKDFIIGNIEVKEEYLTLLEEPDALAIIDDYLSKKVYSNINKQP